MRPVPALKCSSVAACSSLELDIHTMRVVQLSACCFLLATAAAAKLPAQAQLIDQRTFNVLNTTLPPAEFNATSVSGPCQRDSGSILMAKPALCTPRVNRRQLDQATLPCL